jgi:flavin reductase (DIM6/NTAB) family NADH-FMN oxidoreductase RutF
MHFLKTKAQDNFYQVSSFYPMPVVLITTVSESGATNIGSYSLVFPFGIVDKDYLMLISRYDSNTAINIRKTGYCALNFIPYKRKYMKNAVRLGYPGETTEKKLEDSIFTLVPSEREDKIEGAKYPDIIKESVQVMECTWIDDPKIFSYGVEDGSQHFLLEVENVQLQKKWNDALTKGNGKFPSMPIDYGYRDSKEFWFARHLPPISVPIPKDKGVNVSTIKYQVARIDCDIPWDYEAYEKLVRVPRVFLKRVIEGVCTRAREEGQARITPELLDKYKEKKR